MSGGYPTGSPIFDYSSAVNLVGPTVVAFFIQALETGVIIAQFCFFWTHADSPSCVVKGVVLWVCTVAMFQTGAFFAKFWDIFVTHFGGVTDAGWLTSVQPLVTTLMASPVQAFLIWRCFQIFNRNHLLIAPLIVLLVGSIASAIFVTHSFLVDDFSALPVVRHVWAPYILVLSLPALLDVVLTAYLLSFLVRSLRKVYTSRIRRAITRLIVICWEVALPPTMCALLILALFIYYSLHPKPQFWVLSIQSTLGKLHVISLFFFLNGRVEMAFTDRHGGTGSEDGYCQRSNPSNFQLSTLTVPIEATWSTSRHSRLSHVVYMPPPIPNGDAIRVVARSFDEESLRKGPRR